MAVTENDTNDSNVDETNDDEQEYKWEITEEGSRFALRKLTFSKYEFDMGHTTVEFQETRDRDDGLQLRDDDYNTLATVDIENSYIPDYIRTGFIILTEEL